MSQGQPAGGPAEGTRRERRRREVPGLFAGLVLILLGVLLLFQTQGWFTWNDWWKYLLLGLGVIFVVDALVRLSQPVPRPRWGGRLVVGLVLLLVGLIFVAGFGQWWPLILVIIGVGVIVRRAVR
ncbi:MAG: hypothetical protein AB1597_05475 [Chloroflexota bacterium]